MRLQNPADKGKEMPGRTLHGSPSHLHDDTISHSTIASFFPFHISPPPPFFGNYCRIHFLSPIYFRHLFYTPPKAPAEPCC